MHLIITCSISARSVPMMIPSILKATKRSVGNSKNRKKKRKVTNAKESNSYVADSHFICHILDNVYDISETMLVAILQFTIRRLSDSESFHTVMKSLLRAPFNGLFMSRSLRELTNPEVKIVLLYLKRALKLEIVGGKKETNASSSNQNKKKKSRRKGLKGQDDNDTIIGTSISRNDQVLPRIVAWCSMVLDAHFNGVIMRSATTGGDLYVGGSLFIKNNFVQSQGTFDNLLVLGVSTFQGNTNHNQTIIGNRLTLSGVSTFSDTLNIIDNKSINLGTGKSIFSDGSTLNIDSSNNNNIEIKANTDGGTGGKINLVNVGSGVTINPQGTVDVYSSNALRLQVKSSGIEVTGNTKTTSLEVTNLADLKGDVNLGGSSSDDIEFKGRVDSDIIPNISGTYDLGSSSLKWDKIYANQIEINTVIAQETLDVTNLYVSGIAYI